LRLLSEAGRAFSVKELSDQVGCSKSTVERDLATIGSLFALVEEEAGKVKRRYRIAQRIRALNFITVGSMELLALHAAAKSLGNLAGTAIHRDLLDTAAKIRGFLAPQRNGGLDRLPAVFRSHLRGYVNYENHGQDIDDLITAIAQRRVCRVTYKSPWHDSPKSVSVEPLHIVQHDGALYLFCRVPHREGLTTLAIHRIVSVTVSRERFGGRLPNVKAIAQRAFGIFEHPGEEQDVEVLFSEDFAWRIEERTYHPNESKERLEDGRLRYRIRTSAKWEVIPWVLKFGGEAELVHPIEWRSELAQCASKAAQLHAPRPG